MIMGRKEYWRFRLDQVKDDKKRKKLEKMRGTLMGGSITIRRTDGLPMDVAKTGYEKDISYNHCGAERTIDYRLLKVKNEG